ncbi:TetR/AcrR family transcriptional regulator [Pectinatus sottacetonis]|uniref:TetR/AcrR family transcriptional regulator n=1 Tax=Pectinatus sottacetonis TaxID=1002795 RepID=UPI0018C576DE|nr:TetR/AcrR family transcriptional regulator [Pectinatus sottacetonis]
MSEKEITTTQKIIQAAIFMLKENNFSNITMRDIANKANVSEMTVFRHFSNKKGLIEAIINTLSFIPSLQKIFNSKVKWELEPDLELISKTYQEIMEKNKTLYIIILREKTIMSNEDWEILPPYYFKKFMISYFLQMENKEKIKKYTAEEIEALAVAFISMNFGFFHAKVTLKEGYVDVTTANYINTCVKLFAGAMKNNS